ncbi:MAG: acyl-CoA dehydrogenase [Candidatus Tectimicrobiota bacterium]|nr:MAG: acyl-CoA dehydrogenase [Candidatus Tectomicrobia bacterium]
MDFELTESEKRFRDTLRQWLRENLPPGWGTTVFEPVDLHEKVAFLKEWTRKLHAAGYVGLSWPKEYGGAGATLMEQVIFNEEIARFKAPTPYNAIALGMVGPTLIEVGTEAQKKRYLPKMLTCEEIWCQGYSEPGAGSDLASLQTRAVPDGDEFVITGQKVWTSYAHDAAFCFLLARTDPQAPKHKGLSCFIVDMKSPGITIRPLRQMTGEAEFNEIFFDHVRVPRENLVGELNNGWMVGIGLLMHERATTSILYQANLQVLLQDLMALAKRQGRHRDPLIRQRLAHLYTAAEAIKLFGYRCLTKRLRGQPPGPEGSVHRLGLTRLTQQAYELAMELQGPYAQLMHGSPYALQDGMWQFGFLRSRAATIAAGTAEIQKNIIAERVLGLPKG